MLRCRMAEPPSGLLSAWPLSRMRCQRGHLRRAAAVWHRTDRSRLAAFALLGSMACGSEGDGSRRLIADPRGWLMGKRSNFERREADFYPTPLDAVVPLIPYLSSVKSFAEPCAGNGDLVRHLESFGLACVYSGDIRSGQD